MEYTTIILFLIAISSNAVGDALNAKSKYTAGHLVTPVHTLALLLLPYVYNETLDIFNWLIFCVFMWFAFFDYIYNLAAGNKWYYLSDKNLYGRYFGKVNKWVLLTFKIVCLGLAIYLLCDTL